MLEKLSTSFFKYFKNKPYLFKASGRVNIIGEHTDYNLGFSLPVSINKAVYFAIHPNNSKQFNIISLDKGESDCFPIHTANVYGESWGRYFKATVQILQERALPIAGVNLLFGGTLPIGAGLSSSAALCCGFIYSLNTLFDLQLSKKEMALIAQEAEHRIGLMCGLLDQYAILFGKKDHALQVDFQSQEYILHPIDLKEAALVLIDSRLEHNLVEEHEYNERRASCERVVAAIQKEHPEISSLRDISPELLEQYREQIDPVDFGRALFVEGENERVHKAITYLKNGDVTALGQLLYKSQEGQKNRYHISTSEIDQLITLTQQEEDILGARMTGGGFGGCIICLIKKGAMDAVQRVADTYHQQTGVEPAIYPISVEEGIEQLEK